MTRINLPSPSLLADQHLLAEVRELPRVFALARAWSARGKDTRIPPAFTLGEGHVAFFYPADRQAYCAARLRVLRAECARRGFKLAEYGDIPAFDPGPGGVWFPDAAAIALSRSRLVAKLQAKPGFYRYRGEPVAPDFYSLDYAPVFDHTPAPRSAA